MNRNFNILSVLVLLVIVLTACTPASIPAATSTPPQPPKYQGLAESTTCSVGLVLDWDEEVGPDGCVIKDFGDYKAMYYGLDHGGRWGAIAVRNDARQFAWIETIVGVNKNHQTISANGLKGNVSVTADVSASIIIVETITDINMTSDYIQYNEAICQSYLITVKPNDGFDFLRPLIETADGDIALETGNNGMLSFVAWTQDGHKPLASVQYPTEYAAVVQTAFNVGGQWVHARVSNCGGGVLGVEYLRAANPVNLTMEITLKAGVGARFVVESGDIIPYDGTYQLSVTNMPNWMYCDDQCHRTGYLTALPPTSAVGQTFIIEAYVTDEWMGEAIVTLTVNVE